MHFRSGIDFHRVQNLVAEVELHVQVRRAYRGAEPIRHLELFHLGVVGTDADRLVDHAGDNHCKRVVFADRFAGIRAKLAVTIYFGESFRTRSSIRRWHDRVRFDGRCGVSFVRRHDLAFEAQQVHFLDDADAPRRRCQARFHRSPDPHGQHRFVGKWLQFFDQRGIDYEVDPVRPELIAVAILERRPIAEPRDFHAGGENLDGDFLASQFHEIAAQIVEIDLAFGRRTDSRGNRGEWLAVGAEQPGVTFIDAARLRSRRIFRVPLRHHFRSVRRCRTDAIRVGSMRRSIRLDPRDLIPQKLRRGATQDRDDLEDLFARSLDVDGEGVR